MDLTKVKTLYRALMEREVDLGLIETDDRKLLTLILDEGQTLLEQESPRGRVISFRAIRFSRGEASKSDFQVYLSADKTRLFTAKEPLVISKIDFGM